MAVSPSSVRVRCQKPLSPVVMSVADDKCDYEMIPGAVYRSPDICLTPKENPGEPQLMKGCITSRRLKLSPLPPNEIGKIAQHVRKGERRKGWWIFSRFLPSSILSTCPKHPKRKDFTCILIYSPYLWSVSILCHNIMLDETALIKTCWNLFWMACMCFE